MSTSFKETLQSGVFNLLLIFLVGLGSCAGIGIAGSIFDSITDSIILRIQEARFISKLTKKIDNNSATQEEYYVYSKIMADNPEISKIYEKKAPDIINRQNNLNLANNLYDKLKRNSLNQILSSPTLQQVITLNEKLIIEKCYTVDYHNFGKPYYHLYTNHKEYIPLKFNSHFLEHYYGSKGTVVAYKELPQEAFLTTQLISLYYTTHCETDHLPDTDRTSRYRFSKQPDEFFTSDETRVAYIYTLEKILNTNIAPPAITLEQQKLEKKAKLMAEKLYSTYLQRYPSDNKSTLKINTSQL